MFNRIFTARFLLNTSPLFVLGMTATTVPENWRAMFSLKWFQPVHACHPSFSVIGHLPVFPRVMIMPDCTDIGAVIGLPLA